MCFASGLSLCANPVANFAPSVKQGCVPLTVNFTDQSTGGVTSYSWDFGNGNKSSLKNPSAIYYKSGNFTVTLTVSDANGNKSTKTFSPVRVFSNPTVNFSADTVGCIGENLNFTDLSVKADTIITKWTWDFGDGNLNNKQMAGHKYTYSGKFTIGLTIVDGFGCKSLKTKTNYIRIKPTPAASFTLNKTFSCMLPGVFNATNTSTGASSYKWSCSDGSSGTGKDFKTNITNYGKYKVTLVAIGSGCNDTIEKFPVTVEKLSAKFNITGFSLCKGDTIKFTNASTAATGLTYYWDFGDGNTSTDKDPKNKYASSGTFQVKLRVSSGACSDSVVHQVKINPEPDVTISVLDSTGCNPPFNAVFKVNGNDYVASFWNFGDKTPKKNFPKGSPITHTYEKKGNYRASAIITNSYGCTVELKMDNNINVGTQDVHIIPKNVYGCIPKTVEYEVDEEEVTQPIKSYEWVFTDTTTKYNTDKVKKTFYKAGNYLAILTVETVNGCILTDTAEISVGKKYIPSFKILQKHLCNKDTIHYINTSHDSIKKKVTFFLSVVDSTGSIFKDSMFNTEKGGKHLIRIVARHFGCETESENADTIYVHGPFMSLAVRFVDCKYNMVAFKPDYSWANRLLLTKNYFDTLPHKLPYKQKELFTPYGSPFIFKAWNDTFRCFDSLKRWPMAPVHDLGLDYSQNQNCAPAKATMLHNGNLKNAKWIFPNGDTSIAKKTSFVFKEAGVYKIYLVGHFDSSLCQDTNIIMFHVEGATLKGHAFASSKCMPITLNLSDSLAGKDNNYHTWRIGDQIVEAKGLTTLFNIQSMPQKDSMITVRHIVQSAKGCTSEKEYLLPFGGPKANYIYQRFTICDTPVFYFKSYIDSSLTKYPVTFKWVMSSGLVSKAQDFNAKFKTMGMNYFTLSITDKFGCKSAFYDSFEVSPNMLAPAFKADPTGRFCPPLQCQFTDMSKTFNSDIVKWEWDFGDGSTSQLKDPQKLYLVPGSYDITLKLTSRSGCTTVLKKPGYIIINGPRGTYDFDRGNGCLPLTVGFRGTTLDSATMEWDLGDGVIRQGNNFKHVYRERRIYIPAMILTDTLGCKYTLPPIDTIEVFDYPKTRTVLKGLCYHQPIKVSQSTVSNHEDSAVNVSWYFNGNLKSPGKDSMYMPESRGLQGVRVITENKGTCKDTFDNQVRIYAPQTDFNVTEDFVCLGNITKFLNKVKADTTVVYYEWDFGDGAKSEKKITQHTYNAPGQYQVRLIARDILNCEDTMTKPAIAVVGDTISPPIIPIRRASVLNDRHVELVFAKYPTFDFTKYIIYREANNKYYKMADVKTDIDTVFVDQQCNTLKESYCYKVASQNLCLYVSDVQLSREHCTIETKALGQMDANKVTWSPYIGFDSIARYQVWRQDYNQPEAYKLIDSVNAGQLTYIDSLITCNIRQNYRIKAIQHGGFKEFSNSDTATAKPYYINTTKPNYTWRTTIENNKSSRVEWLNNAWSRNGIRGYLMSKSFANGDPIFDYKYFDARDTIYEDDKVKVNEYSYIYYVRGIDNCNDTTPFSNPAQTILLTAYFDETTQKPALKWNHYQLWDQKIAYYEIEQKLEDGTFVLIGKVAANENSFIDMNARQSCSPYYIYRVRAVSYVHAATGNIASSLSNEANALPHSTLFVPNAFSPDLNNINENFGPKGQYISRYKFQIYNRWGEKIFETNDCMVPWDGTFKNERCQEGVYLYHIEALGADNKSYNLQGTFTLLR